MKHVKLILVFLVALYITACATVADRVDDNRSLLYIYILTDELDSNLKWVEYYKVYPKREYGDYRLGMKELYIDNKRGYLLWLDNITNGKYQISRSKISNFVGLARHWVRSSWSRFRENPTTITITSPGVHFGGIYALTPKGSKWQRIAGKIGMNIKKTSDEPNIFILREMLKITKDTSWAEYIKKEISKNEI